MANIAVGPAMQGKVLCESGEQLEHACFPTTSIASAEFERLLFDLPRGDPYQTLRG